MKLLASSLLWCAFSFAQNCILKPCQVSLNISWDTAGAKDTRPQTWGTTDVVNSQVPFLGVPSGYHVRIVRVSGDEVSAPHGIPNDGAQAYVLIGLTNTTPNASPYVGPGLGSMGCFVYKQGIVPSRIPINEKVIGDLNADNILIVKQALFLDEFGPQAPVHMEATLVLQFRYVPN